LAVVFVRAIEEEARKRKDKGSARGIWCQTTETPKNPTHARKFRKTGERRNAEKMGNEEI